MQEFKGMNFVNQKPSTCSKGLKAKSREHMATVIKFVDPEQKLPTCKEYLSK